MNEALIDAPHSGTASHTQTMTASLTLQGVQAVSTIRVTYVGDEAYLDSSTVERKPLGSSP